MKRWTAILCCLMTTPLWAADQNAEPLKLQLKTGQTVVVEKGQGEPESIGSYSIRLYARADDPGFAMDNFQQGVIRPRDGSLTKVGQIRLKPQDEPLAVVVMQSAGSGSYLSADAYSVKGARLTLQRCVRDLPQTADLSAALMAAKGAAKSCKP